MTPDQKTEVAVALLLNALEHLESSCGHDCGTAEKIREFFEMLLADRDRSKPREVH